MYANVTFQVATHMGEVAVYYEKNDPDEKIIKKAKKKLSKIFKFKIVGYQYFNICKKSG